MNELIKEIFDGPIEGILKYIQENKSEEKSILSQLKARDRMKWFKVSSDLKSANLNTRGAAAVRQETIENIIENKDAIELDISTIKPNPAQPRKYWHSGKLKELSDSIKEHGLLQPIVVNKAKNGTYTLIAGERRLRAHEMAGIKSIKAVILEIDQHQSRKLALIENIQRADLLPLEEGIGFKDLIEEGGYSIRDLEDIVQKKRSYIHDRLSLTKFSPKNIDFIFKNEITNVSRLLKILSAEEGSHSILLDKLVAGVLTDDDIESYKIKPNNEPEERIKEVKENMKIANESIEEKNYSPSNTNKIEEFDNYKESQKTNQTKEEYKEQEPNHTQSNENIPKTIYYEDSVIKETSAIKIYGNKKNKVNIAIDIKNITGSDIEAIKEFLASI